MEPPELVVSFVELWRVRHVRLGDGGKPCCSERKDVSFQEAFLYSGVKRIASLSGAMLRASS